MGFDEFGPAYPDAPETIRRPLYKRLIDWAVAAAFVAALLWLLGPS